MRHGKSHRKLGRSPAHRRALMRNLATSILTHGRCRTTIEKAKEARGVVEKLISRATTDSLANRRLAYSFILNKATVHTLFTAIAPAFKSRKGGYTRVVRADIRPGDSSEMAYIELLEEGRQAIAPEAKTDAPAKEKKGAGKKAAKTAKASSTEAATDKAETPKKKAAPRSKKKSE
jgi:large subunit ribosomal protein L17